jgi:hypothetical protein
LVVKYVSIAEIICQDDDDVGRARGDDRIIGSSRHHGQKDPRDRKHAN